jgi:hypothetical protein
MCYAQKSVFDMANFQSDNWKQFIAKREVIVIGELHGTVEVPNVVLKLAKLITQEYGNVTIALEISCDLQDEMDYYFKSNDSTALFSHDYFKVHDGRTSVAMADLIKNLQKIPGVYILCFDIDSGDPTISKRDSLMGRRLTMVPRGKMVVLTGNLHANLNKDFHSAGFKSAIYHLQETLQLGDKLVSLYTFFASGTIWNCMNDGCGPRILPTHGTVSESTSYMVIDDESRIDGYNGYLYFNFVQASPPLLK